MTRREGSELFVSDSLQIQIFFQRLVPGGIGTFIHSEGLVSTSGGENRFFPIVADVQHQGTDNVSCLLYTSDAADE